jgi:hypothetical protein
VASLPLLSDWPLSYRSGSLVGRSNQAVSDWSSALASFRSRVSNPTDSARDISLWHVDFGRHVAPFDKIGWQQMRMRAGGRLTVGRRNGRENLDPPNGVTHHARRRCTLNIGADRRQELSPVESICAVEPCYQVGACRAYAESCGTPPKAERGSRSRLLCLRDIGSAYGINHHPPHVPPF